MNMSSMTKSSNGVGKALSQSQDQLMADVRTVMADTKELMLATAGQTGEKIEQLRTKATASMKAMTERLESAQHSIASQGKEAAEATDAYVHENAWKAIGVASGFGLVIGLLLGRELVGRRHR